MRKLVAVILAALAIYGIWMFYAKHQVRIPMSNVYVRARLFSKPRLWGNAVEFDHRGWQEICIADNGKAKCLPLAKASPK